MGASVPAFCDEPEGLPAAATRRSRLSAWFRVICHLAHLHMGLFADRRHHAASLQASQACAALFQCHVSLQTDVAVARETGLLATLKAMT